MYDAVKCQRTVQWKIFFDFTIHQLHNFTRPECLPVSEGAPSVVILASLSRFNPDLIRLLMTLLYKSFPVTVSLRLHR